MEIANISLDEFVHKIELLKTLHLREGGNVTIDMLPKFTHKWVSLISDKKEWNRKEYLELSHKLLWDIPKVDILWLIDIHNSSEDCQFVKEFLCGVK